MNIVQSCDRSRVPPFMKPNKVRSLLEKYGEVTRLYLAEEGRIMRVCECTFPSHDMMMINE